MIMTKRNRMSETPEVLVGTVSKLARRASFDLARFLNRPHPACPDGEDDGELAKNGTIPTPVFLRFAAEGGEPQKNKKLKKSAVAVSQPSDSPSGQAGWGLAQWQRFLDQTRRSTTTCAISKSVSVG